MGKSGSIKEWEDCICSLTDTYLGLLSDEHQEKVLECIVYEQAKLTSEPDKYIEIWNEYKKGGVV